MHLVSCHKLLGGDLLEAGLGQAVSPLPAAVLDTLEDHDAQHDDETDAHDDGEGQEVGVDIEGLVVRDPDDEGALALLEGVVLHQLLAVSVAQEDRGDDVIPVSAWGGGQ